MPEMMNAEFHSAAQATGRGRALAAVLALLQLGLACGGGSGGPPASPQPETPVAEGGRAVTVYNEGTALVRDRRSLGLASGFNEIAFSDVAAMIDPTSVLFKSLTDPGTIAVLEQNYIFDLVNSAASSCRARTGRSRWSAAACDSSPSRSCRRV
jgi:hypothetical protein